jgi:hypothetical protein
LVVFHLKLSVTLISLKLVGLEVFGTSSTDLTFVHELAAIKRAIPAINLRFFIFIWFVWFIWVLAKV